MPRGCYALYCKRSPENPVVPIGCPSPSLTAPGSPRMNDYKNLCNVEWVIRPGKKNKFDFAMRKLACYRFYSDVQISSSLSLVIISPAPIYTPRWREPLWEYSALPNNTTQWPRPGLKSGPLDPESGALTIRPPRLPQKIKGLKRQTHKSFFCVNVNPWILYGFLFENYLICGMILALSGMQRWISAEKFAKTFSDCVSFSNFIRLYRL